MPRNLYLSFHSSSSDVHCLSNSKSAVFYPHIDSDWAWSLALENEPQMPSAVRSFFPCLVFSAQSAAQLYGEAYAVLQIFAGCSSFSVRAQDLFWGFFFNFLKRLLDSLQKL